MTSPRPPRPHSQGERHRSGELHSALPSTSPPEDGSGAIARSKSRYRRKAGAAEGTSDLTPTAQQQQTPSRYHSKRRSPVNALYQAQLVQSPPTTHLRTSVGGSFNASEHSPPAAPGLVGENSSPPDRRHPVGELFPPTRPAEQPPRSDGPSQSGQIRAKNMGGLPAMDDEAAGCFGGMFRRKQAAPDGADARTTVYNPRTARDAPRTIKPGGGGVMPGSGAPVSAVNSGDRQVMVQCGSYKQPFAVAPETTSMDLLKKASICMAERIDPNSALLMEYFGTVGVQRPIRRYEEIRQVMNSWDGDGQNSLIIVDPGTGTVEPELTIAGAPKDQPEEQAWWLSYSQKVGKWEKRHVVLRADGQLVHMKNPAKAKSTENICHMSDFDIYTPTPDKQRKKIRPPKKFCYAIKSQRKTSMFESTSDFVHFFSTGDRAVAEDFYAAIQGYRSWYLVHVLEAGKKDKPKASVSHPHPPQVSMDSHHQLGSCKPLIDDMSQFGYRSGSIGSQNGPGFAKSPQRHVSTSRGQNPPPALNRPILADDEPLANLGHSTSVKRSTSVNKHTPSDHEFKDSGLLGRKFSQPHQEQSERNSREHQAFMNGGLTDHTGHGVQRPMSARRNANNNEMKRSSSTRDPSRGHQRNGSLDLDRSQSRRHKPQPLVDLTPAYKEPPQHVAKGRGYRPEHIGPGGLIDSATSPEDPLGIPTATVFRRDGEPHMPSPSSHAPGLVDLTPQHQEPIHHARKGKGYTPENSHPGGLVFSASSQEDPLGLPQNNVFRSTNTIADGRQREVSGSAQSQLPHRQLSVRQQPEGFTGEGLLASAANRQGWGTETNGRGVINGSRADGRPLVDLDADHTFSQGSLLNKMQKSGGIPKPIIDREKRND